MRIVFILGLLSLSAQAKPLDLKSPEKGPR